MFYEKVKKLYIFIDFNNKHSSPFSLIPVQLIPEDKSPLIETMAAINLSAICVCGAR